MELTFEAVAEAKPGSKWRRLLFDRHWPAYRAWFLARGGATRPSLATAVERLRRFMPELVPTYERLVELAGGDDTAARFLSMYRPPAYLVQCSQAVWPGGRPGGGPPVLVRNYDLDPALAEGTILHTQWNGRRVIATVECLWGVDDGLNDAGLAVSLTFGGRRVVGDGFGIPLILRYVLEFCATTAEALDVLRRVPSHMAYNVTVLDRRGDFATALVAPDRPTVVLRRPVATNHQGAVEWPEQARFSRTLERERFLIERLADPRTTAAGLIEAFLRPPLYATDYRNGFGTLYTAVYRPGEGAAEFRWPDGLRWRQSFDGFQEGRRTVRYSSSGAEEASPAARRRPGGHRRGHVAEEVRARADAATHADDVDPAAILERVFKTVQDALSPTGYAMSAGFVDELLNGLVRPGEIPWARLGSLWADAGGVRWGRGAGPNHRRRAPKS